MPISLLRRLSRERLSLALCRGFLPITLVALASCGALAQEPVTSPAPVLLAGNEPVRPALPDAPGFSSSVGDAAADAVPSLLATSGGVGFGQVTPNSNGRYSKTVLPGHSAARLTVHDKVILGIKENLSPISAAGWVISAGYEQATNGSPNYGQTGKGFAQRLGAAAARSSSENIFQDSVLASVLHEDPRYYKLGSGHNFFTRVIYAGTRPIIGKTDGGRRTINFSDLGGDLAGAALTQAYYPPLNRGVTEVLKTFGGSVGGDAIGFLASEFLSDALHGLHITRSRD